jgi:hypothetical protein
VTTHERLRLELGARHLHSLGARALAGFLEDLATQADCLSATLALLEDYRRLTPGIVRAVGANRFPRRIWRAA